MENEENRCLINKKDFEDELVPFANFTFCQFNFGALSILSLSHSWTLRIFLENFNIGLRKENKAKESDDQAWKSMIKQLHQDYL